MNKMSTNLSLVKFPCSITLHVNYKIAVFVNFQVLTMAKTDTKVKNQVLTNILHWSCKQTGRRANQCMSKCSFCKNSRTETTFEFTLVCLSACLPAKWEFRQTQVSHFNYITTTLLHSVTKKVKI